MAEYPDIKVVEVDDKADSTIAPTAIGTALQANPDAVGIVGVDAVSGVGAATAVREAGAQRQGDNRMQGQGCGDAGTNQERRDYGLLRAELLCGRLHRD